MDVNQVSKILVHTGTDDHSHMMASGKLGDNAPW